MKLVGNKGQLLRVPLKSTERIKILTMMFLTLCPCCNWLLSYPLVTMLMIPPCHGDISFCVKRFIRI